MTLDVTGKYRRRFLDALVGRSHGLTTAELFEQVYYDDPNGGPESLKIFSVMARQMSKQLRRQGYVIHGELGPGGRFKLMTVQEGRLWRNARRMRASRATLYRRQKERACSTTQGL
jgi:hypothetical protein